MVRSDLGSSIISIINLAKRDTNACFVPFVIHDFICMALFLYLEFMIIRNLFRQNHRIISHVLLSNFFGCNPSSHYLPPLQSRLKNFGFRRNCEQFVGPFSLLVLKYCLSHCRKWAIQKRNNAS